MSRQSGGGEPYVFLSYTSADRPRVLALADRLQTAGVPVWVDRRSIMGGASWDAEIVEGIRGCAAFVLVCSTAALQSPNVQQEIRLAWEYQLPLLPLLLEPTTIPNQIKYPLAGRQWVEILDRPEGEWLPQVFQALARLGVPIRSHGAHQCLQCGTARSPGATFCGHCGAPLRQSTPESRDAPVAIPDGALPELEPRAGVAVAEVPRGAAERRQITVLSCQFLDAAALAAQLDLEEMHDLVRTCHEACAAVIAGLEGHVAQYRGDGLVAYFGYPLAHEDDARRAVRAGLEIVEAMRQLDPQRQVGRRVASAVRLGIHSGLAVVGGAGRAQHEQVAVGETPHLAAQLQELAPPDTILISSATYPLLRGGFTCEPLDSTLPKDAPQPVYRVLGERDAQGGPEGADPGGLVPLVGREQEVGLLSERWERVKDGLGQVVILNGEAGIGKSRLVQMVKAQVASEPHQLWECRGSPYHQNSALFPIVTLFERLLQFQRDDAPDETLRKLEQALAPYARSAQEFVPLFASLLSLPPPSGYVPLGLTPERQKQKTLEAIVTVLLAMAAEQPVVLIVEDLHWVDPSTLELLSLVIDQAPLVRLFVLLTCRPEFQQPWPTRSHLTSLTLNRLSRTQIEVMIERVAGGKALPAQVTQQIATKTDGVPLFVEEMTKMVVDSALLREQADHYELTGPLPALAIPTTLQDLLMARLDRLSSSKEVAQLAATIGREFRYPVLSAVSPLDETTLRRELGRLVDAELIYQRGMPPQATYTFKHALIQDAAYQSLLRSTRRQYHQQIARAVEERFAELVEVQPEVLAHHYTAAGLRAEAITYWQRAGQQAAARSANAEAIAHLSMALDLLSALPATPDRDHRELTLQLALGAPLIAAKSYAAPEVERCYAQARELCQRLGETAQLFPVLFGLLAFYTVRAEFRTVRDLGEQLLTLAQRAQDPTLLLEAHFAMGMTLYYLGEIGPAREHLEQGTALYDPEQHRSLALIYGFDPGVGCRRSVALALWLLGYPNQALRRSNEAQDLARDVAHPYSLASALTFAAALHQHRREEKEVSHLAEAAVTLSSQHGFPLWLTWGTNLQGWALAAPDRLEPRHEQRQKGIEKLRHGLARDQTAGMNLLRPYWLALLIEAYRNDGRNEEGLSLADEALAAVHEHGERWWEAELYRLKGELLLTLGAEHQSAADTCFRQALQIAKVQGARCLELRAAMSLSRLLQEHGKREIARQLLAEIYDWFTEGFDTADLKDAKALLDALS